jgi:hypothetical protein
MAFEKETAQGLLRTYAEILRELRKRNLIRDIAETLVALALKLTLMEGSTAGHDAVDMQGAR